MPKKKESKKAEPKDIETQIEEVSTELDEKPIQTEALAGTHNALTTHLHIKGIFNSIYSGIFLGSLVASVAGLIFGKVAFMDRLKLFPESARSLVSVAGDLIPEIMSAGPYVLGALGLGLLLFVVCWLKRKEWPIGYIYTRLIMLVFWTAVSYWILSVLGLGETVPRWPNF
jgi:hypothetical protein